MEVVLAAKAAAEQIGVTFIDPTIYVPGDGTDAEIPLPADWRTQINLAVAHIGWLVCYKDS